MMQSDSEKVVTNKKEELKEIIEGREGRKFTNMCSLLFSSFLTAWKLFASFRKSVAGILFFPSSVFRVVQELPDHSTES